MAVLKNVPYRKWTLENAYHKVVGVSLRGNNISYDVQILDRKDGDDYGSLTFGFQSTIQQIEADKNIIRHCYQHFKTTAAGQGGQDDPDEAAR
jgi:hypothetical protein